MWYHILERITIACFSILYFFTVPFNIILRFVQLSQVIFSINVNSWSQFFCPNCRITQFTALSHLLTYQEDSSHNETFIKKKYVKQWEKVKAENSWNDGSFEQRKSNLIKVRKFEGIKTKARALNVIPNNNRYFYRMFCLKPNRLQDDTKQAGRF